MTPLHCAARLAQSRMVSLLLESRADASQATFPGRAPGLATPLAVLGEADQSRMPKQMVVDTAVALVRHMSETAFGQVTVPKCQSALHLAASRGNVEFVEVVLQAARDCWGDKAHGGEKCV